MKAQKLRKKLTLNKKTVVSLSNVNLKAIHGGYVPTRDAAVKTCVFIESRCLACLMTDDDLSCAPTLCNNTCQGDICQ